MLFFFFVITKATLTVKVFEGHFMLPAIHRYLVSLSIGMASRKINLNIFLTLHPSSLPGAYTFIRQFGHCMWLCSERDHLFSSTFWLVIRTIFYYFTIWDSSLTIPGHDAFLFTRGNPRLVGWPPSQEGA